MEREKIDWQANGKSLLFSCIVDTNNSESDSESDSETENQILIDLIKYADIQ